MAHSALVRELKCQIEAAEADARMLRARVFEAEERAARAERAARDAWSFARALFKRPTPSSTAWRWALRWPGEVRDEPCSSTPHHIS
jgi:hypothetical protein